MAQNIDQLSAYIEGALKNLDLESLRPQELYQPIRYGLEAGGKRIRPLLCLLCCQAAGGSLQEATPVALAYEIFHNFTLLHDDVMDNSPLRRGKPSVMSRFGSNAAILSGDAMLVWAYQMLLGAHPNHADLLTPFSLMATQVMQGQQWDMNFETTGEVSIPQYLEMIRLKTAVLLADAAAAGTRVAAVPPQDTHLFYHFALNLGMAFQLQDDYLDLFGDARTFGKPIGGDVLEKKKTILYLLALQQADAQQTQEIQDLYAMPRSFAAEKIQLVADLFTHLGVKKRVKALVEEYLQESDRYLNRLAEGYDTHQLSLLGEKIRNRNV